MHYYEKLIILCVLFIGVTITTFGIIGKYVATKKDSGNATYPNNNSLIISSIKF